MREEVLAIIPYLQGYSNKNNLVFMLPFPVWLGMSVEGLLRKLDEYPAENVKDVSRHGNVLIYRLDKFCVSMTYFKGYIISIRCSRGMKFLRDSNLFEGTVGYSGEWRGISKHVFSGHVIKVTETEICLSWSPNSEGVEWTAPSKEVVCEPDKESLKRCKAIVERINTWGSDEYFYGIALRGLSGVDREETLSNLKSKVASLENWCAEKRDSILGMAKSIILDYITSNEEELLFGCDVELINITKAVDRSIFGRYLIPFDWKWVLCMSKGTGAITYDVYNFVGKDGVVLDFGELFCENNSYARVFRGRVDRTMRSRLGDTIHAGEVMGLSWSCSSWYYIEDGETVDCTLKRVCQRKAIDKGYYLVSKFVSSKYYREYQDRVSADVNVYKLRYRDLEKGRKILKDS